MLVAVLILCSYSAIVGTILLLHKPPVPPSPTTTTGDVGSNVGVTYMDAKHENAIQVEVDE